MNLASDLTQLAHLVRLLAEEAKSFPDVAEDMRVQLQPIAEKALDLAGELEMLATAAAPLMSAVGPDMPER